MSGKNEFSESIETIIEYKAKLMIDKKELTEHIKRFLAWRNIDSNDIPEEILKICAVDAMIFDIGAALNRREFQKTEKRMEILKKIFPRN